MGLVSTVALILPIFTIFAMGLAGYRTFPALVIYYAMSGIYNLLTEGYLPASDDFTHYFGVTNNLLDTPLMLLFLTYLSPSQLLKKRMRILVAVFLVFEAVVVSVYGFGVESVTVILGPGILLVLTFSIPFFIRLTRITITHYKATGKAMMAASILFGYGCFSIIYIMYYLLEIRDVQNTFLVYFMVSTFSSLLMSVGIILERKRVKKLSELKVVRKELSEVYRNEKAANPLRPAAFDFDKDLWN